LETPRVFAVSKAIEVCKIPWGLDGPPTRTGSLDVESENVLHSDVLEEKTWPLLTHTIRKPSDETVYITYLDGNCNESYPNERMK
jgi:hypothetical protein